MKASYTFTDRRGEPRPDRRQKDRRTRFEVRQVINDLCIWASGRPDRGELVDQVVLWARRNFA